MAARDRFICTYLLLAAVISGDLAIAENSLNYTVTAADPDLQKGISHCDNITRETGITPLGVAGQGPSFSSFPSQFSSPSPIYLKHMGGCSVVTFPGVALPIVITIVGGAAAVTANVGGGSSVVTAATIAADLFSGAVVSCRGIAWSWAIKKIVQAFIKDPIICQNACDEVMGAGNKLHGVGFMDYQFTRACYSACVGAIAVDTLKFKC